MSNPKFPKAVEFLRNAMMGREGFDRELAQEMSELIKDLSVALGENDRLRVENETLGAALEVAQQLLDESFQPESDVPQFPDDFYVYGGTPLSYRPTEEEIQELIDDVYDIDLGDGGLVEVTKGDTIVIKSNVDGVEKIYVAQGYYETTLDEQEDEEEVCCGDPYPYCSDCPDN